MVAGKCKNETHRTESALLDPRPHFGDCFTVGEMKELILFFASVFIGNFQRRGTSRRLAGLLPVGILPALNLPVPSGFAFLFCLSCSTRVGRSRRLLVSSLLPPLSPFLSSPLLPLFDLPPPPVRPPVGWVAYRHLDIEWHFRSKQTS